MTNIFKYSFLVLLGLLVTACSTDDGALRNADNEDILVDEFGGMSDKCFEVIYPLNYEMPDGSLISIDDRSELLTAYKQWREDNPDEKGRPELVYPLEVIDPEGEMLTITSADELKEVVRGCKEKEGADGTIRKPCIELLFPLTYKLEDGTEITGADKAELRAALRQWKEDNPDVKAVLELVYPVNVKNEDGDTIVVNSEEELQALKDDC